MKTLYYRRIIAKIMTVNDVPSLWNRQVRDMFEENGYTINDDGIVTKKTE